MKPSPIEKTASKAAQEKLPAAGQTAAFQNSASSAEADLSQLVPHFLENAQSHTMLGMKKLHAEQNCARENLIFLLKREASAEGGDLARLALDYLEDWQLSRNRSNLIPKSVQAAKIEALGANLHRCVMHLEKLSADGDRESVQLLAHHTLRAAKWLSSTRKNQLKLIKPIARQSVFWPVLKSRCQHFDDLGKSLNQHDAVFLRDLGVGREHLIQGCKVKLDDELGVLMLDLIDEVESNKPMLHFSPLPKGWRADAIQLPRLSARRNVVAQWEDVLYRALSDRFSSPAAMAAKFNHLVSKKKRVGVKTTLGELRHLMTSKLSKIAGMGCRGKDSTPKSAWHAGHTKNFLQKKKINLISRI